MSDVVPASNARRAQLGLELGTLAVVGWGWMLTRLTEGDVYAGLGPYSLVIACVALLVSRSGVVDPARAIPPAWRRDVGVGVAVGVVMAVGTHVVYAGIARVLPGLAAEVGALYTAAHAQRWPIALAWTSVVIVAEELLFRMWIFDAAAMRFPPAGAAGISLLAYVAVQLASGSWVIALAALVCGAIWTAERVWTRSWVAPLISHAIWTLMIVHAVPVR